MIQWTIMNLVLAIWAVGNLADTTGDETPDDDTVVHWLHSPTAEPDPNDDEDDALLDEDNDVEVCPLRAAVTASWMLRAEMTLVTRSLLLFLENWGADELSPAQARITRNWNKNLQQLFCNNLATNLGHAAEHLRVTWSWVVCQIL